MLLAIVAMLLHGCLHSQPIEKNATTVVLPAVLENVLLPRACFEGGQCVSLEIADTEQEREIGLMNRTHLPLNEGMLFVFQESAQHAFWMKNTLVPLGIAWLEPVGFGAEKYRVVDVQKMVPCESEPCEIYRPRAPAKYALELNSSAVQEYNLREGQQLSLQFAQAK